MVKMTERLLGYRLGLCPGGLHLTGDTEASPEVIGLIQGHRDGLLAPLLAEAERDPFEERAGILEYEAGFTRAEAEHQAGAGNRCWIPDSAFTGPSARQQNKSPISQKVTHLTTPPLTGSSK